MYGSMKNFVTGQLLLQFGDERFCGVDLADADGVDPDAGLVGVLARNTPETLRPAGAIAVVAHHAVDDFRGKRRDSKQI